MDDADTTKAEATLRPLRRAVGHGRRRAPGDPAGATGVVLPVPPSRLRSRAQERGEAEGSVSTATLRARRAFWFAAHDAVLAVDVRITRAVGPLHPLARAWFRRVVLPVVGHMAEADYDTWDTEARS
jgi:hypothetical protein